jgi:hypothetical protein
MEAHDIAVEKELLLGPRMKVICAWCGATIREADQEYEGEEISHGICTQCVAKEKKGLVGASNIPYETVEGVK